MTADIPSAPDNFPSRRLCPDGSCLGVIGPDGRCTVCGRFADAKAAKNQAVQSRVATNRKQRPVDGPVAADDDILSLPSAVSGEEDEFDPGRRLCPDGSCLGVIGENGRCTICGRLADDSKK